MPLTMEAKLSSRRMIPAASAMDVNPQREPKERKEQKKKINNFFVENVWYPSTHRSP